MGVYIKKNHILLSQRLPIEIHTDPQNIAPEQFRKYSTPLQRLCQFSPPPIPPFSKSHFLSFQPPEFIPLFPMNFPVLGIYHDFNPSPQDPILRRKFPIGAGKGASIMVPWGMKRARISKNFAGFRRNLE